MTWSSALPAVLVAVAVLVLPGVPVALAAGARGVRALGLAAPLSVSVVGVSAVVAGWAGAPFGVPVVLAGSVVAAVSLGGVLVGAALVQRRARRRRLDAARAGASDATSSGSRVSRRSARMPSDGVATLTAALAGVVVGGACAGWAFVRAVRSPQTFPQTYDAVFHLNAVWHIVQSGDGSSLTLGAVASPEHPTFYPGVWHDVAALVASVSGVPVTVAASVVALVIAAVVWPTGSVLLVREVVGAQPSTLFAAGVLCAGLGATPYLLLSYGTLWPNALATALLPAVLACGAGLLLPRRLNGLGRLRAGALAAACLPGLALAHPNAVVSVLGLATVAGLTSLGQWALWAGGTVLRRLGMALTVSAVVLLGEAWFVVESPVFATTRGTHWPSRQTLAQALGEWVAAAPMRTPVPWLMAGLVVLGCVVAASRAEQRWLFAAHAAAGAAFVLVAGSDGPVSAALSGPWYDDPFRLAGLLGVTGVPLATLGLVRVADRLGEGRRRPAARPAGPPGRGWPVPMVPVLAVLLAVVSGGMYAGQNARVVGTWYHEQALAGPAERALLARLPALVPEGVAIAGNPWNGSALAAPLGSRPVLYPHLAGVWGSDRQLVAQQLDDAAREPQVCAAVARLRLGFVLDGPIRFWRGDRRQRSYPGLQVAGHPGFEPVARGGRLTLYRITACT